VATFAGGAIVSYPGGTFAYPNVLRTKFLANGGIQGSLGWPTNNATFTNYMWTQSYQNGSLRTSTRPNVSKGQTNAHVTYLQKKLKISPVTGFFGNVTLAAVRRYQTAHGLAVTGVVTTAMWDLLG
jgi:peptidoglycan hydrolase-like protein with peptidoglycan-binding domain